MRFILRFVTSPASSLERVPRADLNLAAGGVSVSEGKGLELRQSAWLTSAGLLVARYLRMGLSPKGHTSAAMREMLVALSTPAPRRRPKG